MAIIALSIDDRNALSVLVRSARTPQAVAKRGEIILELDRTQSVSAAMDRCGVSNTTVWTWLKHWQDRQHELKDLSGKVLVRRLTSILSQRRPPGLTTKFTPAQVAGILALACEPPIVAEVRLAQWTITTLTDEAIRRGIVPSIARSTVHVFLKSGRTQAPQSRAMAEPA
ncbi:MAG: helix-turn-helix domain-containing protein [bacterium]|nr:helix-turn-helix domain-containing protein [bacterium]